MEMVKAILMLAAGSVLNAADFSLTIGNPAAAGLVTKVKGSVFAVRLEQCADATKSQLTGTAEGLVNGDRKTVPLQLATTATPNVYVVPDTWGSEGAWVVSLKATCLNAKAGAIVTIGPTGFLRESTKVFPRFATPAEVEASLKLAPPKVAATK